MQGILKNDYKAFTTDTEISSALASYTAPEYVKWNNSCVVLGDGWRAGSIEKTMVTVAICEFSDNNSKSIFRWQFDDVLLKYC